MKRILITDITTNIGQYRAAELLMQNPEVVGMPRWGTKTNAAHTAIV